MYRCKSRRSCWKTTYLLIYHSSLKKNRLYQDIFMCCDALTFLPNSVLSLDHIQCYIIIRRWHKQFTIYIYIILLNIQILHKTWIQFMTFLSIYWERQYEFIWGPVCQKQVSRAETCDYIPQYMWDVIICPCLWYLPLAQKSSYVKLFPFGCCWILLWCQ